MLPPERRVPSVEDLVCLHYRERLQRPAWAKPHEGRQLLLADLPLARVDAPGPRPQNIFRQVEMAPGEVRPALHESFVPGARLLFIAGRSSAAVEPLAEILRRRVVGLPPCPFFVRRQHPADRGLPLTLGQAEDETLIGAIQEEVVGVLFKKRFRAGDLLTVAGLVGWAGPSLVELGDGLADRRRRLADVGGDDRSPRECR